MKPPFPAPHHKSRRTLQSCSSKASSPRPGIHLFYTSFPGKAGARSSGVFRFRSSFAQTYWQCVSHQMQIFSEFLGKRGGFSAGSGWYLLLCSSFVIFDSRARIFSRAGTVRLERFSGKQADGTAVQTSAQRFLRNSFSELLLYTTFANFA